MGKHSNEISNPVMNNLQGLSIIVALAFLLMVPNIINPIIQIGIGTAIFVLAGYIAFKFFQLKMKFYSLLFFAIFLIFNPINSFFFGLNQYFVLEIIAAISIFISAMNLSKDINN